MFSITKKSSASEWNYLSLVNYYLGKKSRKKAKRKRRYTDNEDDDTPQLARYR